jgi:predicted HicB family RNase H-like nuclease
MLASDERPEKPPKQQFNVYLPPDLIRRVKYRALDDQTSLSELVERALFLFLNDGEPHD